MRTLSFRHAGYSAAVLVILAAGTVLAETADLTEALILGPLPAVPEAVETPRVRAEREVIREIDPAGWLPSPDDKVTVTPGREIAWRRIGAGGDGFTLSEAGVYWLAARLVTTRFGEVELTVPEEATVFVDGNEVTEAISLMQGERFVFVRAVAEDSGATVAVSAESDMEPSWDLEPTLSLADFDRTRHVASIGSLAIAPKGKLIARRLSRRNPEGDGRRSEVTVLDGKGVRVASDLGGPGAQPVAFSPDGRQLLLRRKGVDGTDLLLWTAPHGPMRTIVTDEPGLGLVRFSPDGKHLLLASRYGLDPKEEDKEAARRWDALRERVTDWDPLPHLHLVEIATGARRVLTRSGDWTLDDAVWLPDGRSIVYGRTLPQVERPWFYSEIRRIDLASGEDTPFAVFTAGWEVRPQAFAAHPDADRLAFIGPPQQVGGGRAEHNVYNKQVWSLDLESGVFERVTVGMPYAFATGSGLPAWERDETLVLPANHESRNVLVRLENTRDGWRAEEIKTAPETGGDWAMSPDNGAIAYTASGLTAPEALHWQKLGGQVQTLEEPNRDLARRWLLATVEDATFTGPGGDNIEAWWYRPATPAGDAFDGPVDANRAAVPLIVYYYGGATPVIRGFNTTHQFWAAHGYAVLVINPRGAHGFGDRFADFHAGDWGPAASADIMGGVQAMLARFPQIDPERIGGYGGSYGGFMTMYLVSHSDLFAAAVAMYGISDLATYWGQGAWGWTYGDMATAGQTPWRDAEYFVRSSPLYAADRVNTPLLLLHGDADTNVTPGESAEMFTALQTLGRTVEMVTFPGEDHGIAGTLESYVLHRTMMLEWFDRWLRDRPEAWAHRWE